MTTPNNDELQAQTHLIRTVEAHLKIAVLDAEELRFREAILKTASDKIDSLKQGFIVRLYEAACDVKFPSASVCDFRKALHKSIAKAHGLKAPRRAATTA
jgi:hypothetical protein